MIPVLVGAAAAGVREREKVSEVGVYGVYWTSSCGSTDKNAWHVEFGEKSCSMDSEERWCSFAVRLVKDIDAK